MNDEFPFKFSPIKNRAKKFPSHVPDIQMSKSKIIMKFYWKKRDFIVKWWRKRDIYFTNHGVPKLQFGDAWNTFKSGKCYNETTRFIHRKKTQQTKHIYWPVAIFNATDFILYIVVYLKLAFRFVFVQILMI